MDYLHNLGYYVNEDMMVVNIFNLFQQRWLCACTRSCHDMCTHVQWLYLYMYMYDMYVHQCCDVVDSKHIRRQEKT